MDHAGPFPLLQLLQTDFVYNKALMLYSHHKIWLIVILPTVDAKEVIFIILGVILLLPVLLQMHATHILQVQVKPVLAIHHAQVREQWPSINLKESTPQPQLMLLKLKFIVMDQSKLDSWFTMIYFNTVVVSM